MQLSKLALTAALGLAVAFILSCSEDKDDGSTNDIAYKTKQIGTQIWMAENLNDEPGIGNSRCYKNDDIYCEEYGRLYDWGTAMVACPSGWHLPSNEEWEVLANYAGGSSIAGGKLKATSGWNNVGDDNGNGTDAYGFAALPGGSGYSVNVFSGVGYGGSWWSASGDGFRYAYGWHISYAYEEVAHYSYDVSALYSVRCVKD